jgi:retron-type reverse transcriptase
MFRFFVPKPNKPGKLRPITEPAKVDRLLLEAFYLILTEAENDDCNLSTFRLGHILKGD